MEKLNNADKSEVNFLMHKIKYSLHILKEILNKKDNFHLSMCFDAENPSSIHNIIIIRFLSQLTLMQENIHSN